MLLFLNLKTDVRRIVSYLPFEEDIQECWTSINVEILSLDTIIEHMFGIRVSLVDLHFCKKDTHSILFPVKDDPSEKVYDTESAYNGNTSDINPFSTS
jgi:hypothetical protein